LSLSMHFEFHDVVESLTGTERKVLR